MSQESTSRADNVAAVSGREKAAKIQERRGKKAAIAEAFLKNETLIPKLLKEVSEKKAENAKLLRENPWLGNIRGIINKQADREDDEVASPQEEVVVPEEEVRGEPVLEADLEIPKIQKRRRTSSASPVQNSRQVLKKKVEELARKQKKAPQFQDPDHPQFGK